jgi:YD repeat-containing protein
MWSLLVGVACWTVGASDASATPVSHGVSLDSLAGPLVVPQAQRLLGSEPELAAVEAQRDSPEAVVTRESSREAYENESPSQVVSTLDQAFPSLLSMPDGGPPQLSAGQRIVGFQSSTTAQVTLPEGQAGVLESSAPIAVASAPGHLTALDLGLSESGGVFAPTTPLIPVSLPRTLGEGAQIPSLGVSITPIDGSGTVLGGSEGAAEGAGVVYANTGTDSDTVLKPTTFGVDATATLRSVRSPQTFYYRLGLPAGASLVAMKSVQPGLAVVREGATLLTIPDPTATDASGQPVATTMTAQGDMVVVSVAASGGSYQYPIEVDPEFATVWGNIAVGAWQFHEWVGYKYEIQKGAIAEVHEGSFVTNDYAEWSSYTQGYTKIFHVYAKYKAGPYYTNGKLVSWLDLWLEMKGPGGERHAVPLGGTPWEQTLCASEACSPEGIENSNGEVFGLTTNEAGSEFFYANAEIATEFAQEKGQHSTVSWNREPEELVVQTESGEFKTPNVLDSNSSASKWLGPNYGAMEFSAHDGGLGVDLGQVEVKPGGSFEVFYGKNLIETSACKGVQCASSESFPVDYNSLVSDGKRPPEGEDKMRADASSPMPYSSSSEHGEGEVTVKVDATKPHNIKLTTAMPEKEGVYEDSELPAHVKIEAEDGEGSTPSSGIKSIALEIDDHALIGSGGSCTPGPCYASYEWQINGAELGAGTHELTAVVTDNADNIETKSWQVLVHHAAPVAIGPGSVNPESGDFAIEANEATLSGGMGSLGIERHLDSRNPAEGVQSPLGPEWTVGQQSLDTIDPLPNGALLSSSEGLTMFTNNSGKLKAPSGDSDLALEYKSEYEGKEAAYILTNTLHGTTTVFRLPTGSLSWMPTVSKSPIATDTLTDEYRSVEVSPGQYIIEPTLELAPHPSATCAREKFEAGCRALEYVYQEGEGTAKGEARSEWGSYKNRLKEVIAIAYEPKSKTMAHTPVAAYEYDKNGRLRAAWNPAITPALKTTYGYDPENHLTAVTPPGQATWALTYGTIPTDTSGGRLLKVTRAPASNPLWNGQLPANTTAPTITGEHTLASTLTAAHGAWNNEPVVYGYQWTRCNSAGSECTSIAGATNPSYELAKADVGHTLRVLVTATNAGGSIVAQANQTALISEGTAVKTGEATPEPGSTVEYEVPLTGASGLPTMTSTEMTKWGQTHDIPIDATAIIQPTVKPQPWPAHEYAGATAYYMDGQARTTNIANPYGGLSITEYNSENEITRNLTAVNRATALKESSPQAASELLDTKNTYNGENQLTDVIGPRHTVRLAHGKKEGEEILARNHVKYYYDEERPPLSEEKYDLVTKTEDYAENASKETFDSRTTENRYEGQNNIGWRLRKPTSVIVDPGGLDLVSTTEYNRETGAVEETIPPGAKNTAQQQFYRQFGNTGTHALSHPRGIVVDQHGNVWVVDSGNYRVQEFSENGTWLNSYGKYGSGLNEVDFMEPWGIAITGTGTFNHRWVYVVDRQNNRVVAMSESGKFERSIGQSGEGAGDLKEPHGIVFGPEGLVYVADTGNRRIDVFSEEGTFMLAFGWGVKNGASEFQLCTSTCRAGLSGKNEGEFEHPMDVGDWAGELFVSDSDGRVQLFRTNGTEKELTEVTWLQYVGEKGTGLGQFENPGGTAFATLGETWLVDTGNGRIDVFNSSLEPTETLGSKGTGMGQFQEPEGIAKQEGSETFYVTDVKANAIDEWKPAITGQRGAEDTKTFYYSAGTESPLAACDNHPEWVNLPCTTRPKSQPGTERLPLPSLPETIIKYNMWDEPEVKEEIIGSVIRTKTTTFDAAGRPLSSETIAKEKKGSEEKTWSEGKTMPAGKVTYNTTNGLAEEQTATEGSSTHKTVSVYNRWGELERYTDADGNTATYSYYPSGQLKEMTDGSEGGKGKDSYAYSEASGALTSLTDSGAGVFGATYDAEGRIATESYPNGMTAYYTYNSVGQATGIEYKKLTHCTEKCVWFSDVIDPSIHGEPLRQASTLAEESNYVYDNAGRLTEVQEIPTGEGCKTRLYNYDEEGERLSEVQREPTSEKKCAAEGGNLEWHTYDTGGMLEDPGTTYDAVGDVTTMPAADAGGAELAASYYVDGQVAKQTQSGLTQEFHYDPTGRTRETISEGTKAGTTITHYDGEGQMSAWTSAIVGGKEVSTRNVDGIDGTLAAIQITGSEVELQLHDLSGNIIATAQLSETATKLKTTYSSSELGVPTKGQPPKYAWLGAEGATSEVPGGTVTQDGVTYVPQTAVTLQTRAIEIPAALQAPTAFSDPEPAWATAEIGQAAAHNVAMWQQARAAAAAANAPAGAPSPEGEGEEWIDPEKASCSQPANQ